MMSNESMAGFICELRKSKNLTQKQLAERLNITDKAVSKWERGLGYPDITTLSLLAEILGVTTNELLNGKREEVPVPKADVIIENTLQYAQKVTVSKSKNIRSIMKFVITASSVLAIIVCVICDLSLTQSLTWSLYPISGIVFAWLILIPLFHFEKNAVAISLTSLSIFIVPFLFFLEKIVGGAKWLFTLGIPITVVSLVYLWGVFLLFKKIQRSKCYVLGIALLIGIQLNFVINLIISRVTKEPFFDVWDAMSIVIVTIIATTFFAVGYFCNKKTG